MDEYDWDDDYEEYITYDKYKDLTEPGLYDREPPEPCEDYWEEDED